MPTPIKVLAASAALVPWPIRSGAWQVQPRLWNTPPEFVEAPAAFIGAVDHDDVPGHGVAPFPIFGRIGVAAGQLQRRKAERRTQHVPTMKARRQRSIPPQRGVRAGCGTVSALSQLSAIKSAFTLVRQHGPVSRESERVQYCVTRVVSWAWGTRGEPSSRSTGSSSATASRSSSSSPKPRSISSSPTRPIISSSTASCTGPTTAASMPSTTTGTSSAASPPTTPSPATGWPPAAAC